MLAAGLLSLVSVSLAAVDHTWVGHEGSDYTSGVHKTVKGCQPCDMYDRYTAVHDAQV